MTGIYKITNTKTNKTYIGQSTNIPQRWHAHLHEIGHGRGLAKYIPDATVQDFSFEIVELCAPEELDERERYWITHYDSYEDGMNRAEGGKDGKHKLREDTYRMRKVKERHEMIEKKVQEYVESLKGKEFSIEETKSIVRDLKKLGLTNAKQCFNYSFSFVKKYCKEKNLCNFKTIIKRKNNQRLTFYKIF